MAVKIATKGNTKSKTQGATKVPLEVRVAVDEAAKIAGELAELEGKVKALKASQGDRLKIIKEYAAAELADRSATVVVKGDHSQAVFGPGSQKREITDKVGLYQAIEKIKEGTFFELCDISLSAVDKVLAPAESEKYISKAHSDSRSVKYAAL